MKKETMRAIVLLALIIFYSFSQSISAQTGNAKKINEFIMPFADAGHFAGVVLAMEDGNIIYEKAFGLANADFDIPNSLDTRIGIASITKSMTQVILLQLIDEGTIAMDDKLSKYIPDFQNGDKITIEMLANHRSGIPHRVMPPEMEAVSYTSEDMVEKINQAELEFEPGTERLYSSAGYAVLARTLEIASNKSYAKLLQEYVFDPADMEDSFDFKGKMIIKRKAKEYFFSPTGLINAELKDYSFLLGAGSVISTARDVYKFGMAVLDGKYGETVKSDLVGENGIYGSGRTNGHRAYFEIARNKKYGYVVLSNLSTGAFDLVAQGLGDILQGKEVDTPNVPNPKIVPNLNSNVSEFFGKYRREGSSSGGFEVFMKDGQLFAGTTKLYPTKKDCFFEYYFYGEVCFVRDEKGTVKHIIWNSPGVSSTWVRY